MEEKDIPTISNEADLLAALKHEGRFLLPEMVKVNAEGTRYETRYAVMEKGEPEDVPIAWVDVSVARNWIGGRKENGPYAGAWHLPEFSGFAG